LRELENSFFGGYLTFRGTKLSFHFQWHTLRCPLGVILCRCIHMCHVWRLEISRDSGVICRAYDTHEWHVSNLTLVNVSCHILMIHLYIYLCDIYITRINVIYLTHMNVSCHVWEIGMLSYMTHMNVVTYETWECCHMWDIWMLSHMRHRNFVTCETYECCHIWDIGMLSHMRHRNVVTYET